jgi:hypothetical protein
MSIAGLGANATRMLELSFRQSALPLLGVTALAYEHGYQQASGDDASMGRIAKLGVEAAASTFLMQHTTGVYPLWMALYGTFRAGQKDNLLSQIQTLVRTTVPMAMGGYVGNHIGRWFTEWQMHADNVYLKKHLTSWVYHQPKGKEKWAPYALHNPTGRHPNVGSGVKLTSPTQIFREIEKAIEKHPRSANLGLSNPFQRAATSNAALASEFRGAYTELLDSLNLSSVTHLNELRESLSEAQGLLFKHQTRISPKQAEAGFQIIGNILEALPAAEKRREFNAFRWQPYIEDFHKTSKQLEKQLDGLPEGARKRLKTALETARKHLPADDDFKAFSALFHPEKAMADLTTVENAKAKLLSVLEKVDPVILRDVMETKGPPEMQKLFNSFVDILKRSQQPDVIFSRMTNPIFGYLLFAGLAAMPLVTLINRVIEKGFPHLAEVEAFSISDFGDDGSNRLGGRASSISLDGSNQPYVMFNDPVPNGGQHDLAFML